MWTGILKEHFQKEEETGNKCGAELTLWGLEHWLDEIPVYGRMGLHGWKPRKRKCWLLTLQMSRPKSSPHPDWLLTSSQEEPGWLNFHSCIDGLFKHWITRGWKPMDNYGGRESSARCNFRKHTQIEKAPASQENIISLTAGAANAHNTTNQLLYLQRVSLFGCVVSICVCVCVFKLMKLFS